MEERPFEGRVSEVELIWALAAEGGRVPHPKIAVFAILQPALSGAEGVGTLTLHPPKKNRPKLRDLKIRGQTGRSLVLVGLSAHPTWSCGKYRGRKQPTLPNRKGGLVSRPKLSPVE